MTTPPEQVRGVQLLDAVAAKALDDDDYRSELIADPVSVLRREGLGVPDGLEVVVLENTAERVYLVLPPPPPDGELDPDEVELDLIIPLNKF